MKKCLATLLALSLLMGSATACGGAADSAGLPAAQSPVSQEPPGEGETVQDSPVSITWATWCLSEESLAPTYEKMAETFMADNPEISIEYVTYPYANYKDQLIISAVANTAPDISHIKAEWMPDLMDLGALMDLNPVLSEEVKQDYFQNFLDGVTFDGKILAAPWFNNPMAMFYNKTLLEKAGVAKLPQNWEELMQAARKISALGTDENGNKIYGYAIPITKTEPAFGYNFFSHMWAWGGEFIDENGNIVINSPENVAAFDELRTLVADEITPNGATCRDIRNLFAQGVVGFFYDLEMAAGVFAEASPKGADFAREYGAMVIPKKDGPDGYAYTTEHLLAVSKDARETEAIAKYIDHLTGGQVLQILYDGGMGKMPDRQSAAELNIFANPESEVTRAFVDALQTVRSLPTSNSAFTLADEAFADSMALLSISDDPTEKIVADLDARVKELYGQ